MAAVSNGKNPGRCPLTLGIALWTATGSWDTPGGPGYVDVKPA